MKHLTCLLLLLGAAFYAPGPVPETSQTPFTVTITAIKPALHLGEPVKIHIVMRSVSQEPFEVPEMRHFGRAEMNYSNSGHCDGWIFSSRL